MISYDERPPDRTLWSWLRSCSKAEQAVFRQSDLLLCVCYYGLQQLRDGENNNLDIQRWRRHPKVGRYWEARGEVPEMRWQFEHTICFGGMEVWSWAKKKHWGRFEWLGPLRYDDPIDGLRIGAAHKPSSPFRRRLEQRYYLKDKLGGHRSLVGKAKKVTLKRWLEEVRGHQTSMKNVKAAANAMAAVEQAKMPLLAEQIEPEQQVVKTFDGLTDAEWAISEKLGMTLEDFWRFAKGSKWIDREVIRAFYSQEDSQLVLFE